MDAAILLKAFLLQGGILIWCAWQFAEVNREKVRIKHK